MLTSIILRADDAGVSLGTNEAICKSIDAGVIHNVGLMAPAPEFEDAVTRLKRYVDRVCFGVHATLTAEWLFPRWGAVSTLPSESKLLRADGTFFPNVADACQCAPLEWVRQEVCAQIAAVRRAGIEPSYLDTHMVFTWVPELAELMAEIAEDEGLVFGNSNRYCGVNFRDPAGKLLPIAQWHLRDSTAQGIPVAVFHPAYPDKRLSELILLGSPEKGDCFAPRIEEADFLIEGQVQSSLKALGIASLNYA